MSSEKDWTLGGYTLTVQTPADMAAAAMNHLHGAAVWMSGYSFVGTEGSTLNIDAATHGAVSVDITTAGKIEFDNLIIHAKSVGILAQDGETNITVKKVHITAAEGMSSITDKDKITITTDDLKIDSTDLGIQTGGSGVVDITTKTLQIDAVNNAIQALYGSGDIDITVTEAANIKGDVVTGTAGQQTNDSISLTMSGEKSVLEGAVITNSGETTLGLNDGATWSNTGSSNVTNLSLNGGVVEQTADADSITVDTLTGIGTLSVETAESDQMVITKKADDAKLTVATSNQDLTLEELVDVATLANTEEGTSDTAADTVKKTNGSVFSEESADVDQTTGELINVSQTVDDGNIGAQHMANLGLISWRSEMNDMNKRLGELRSANGEHGVWARIVRGQDEYKSVKNQYTQYQLGYDQKVGTDSDWTLGAAISYTDATNTFTNGRGENTNTALSLYGSKLNDDGTFIDLIAKYANMENEFELRSGMGDADYSTHGYSFSAEVGKRIQQNGF